MGPYRCIFDKNPPFIVKVGFLMIVNRATRWHHDVASQMATCKAAQRSGLELSFEEVRSSTRGDVLISTLEPAMNEKHTPLHLALVPDVQHQAPVEFESPHI